MSQCERIPGKQKIRETSLPGENKFIGIIKKMILLQLECAAETVRTFCRPCGMSFLLSQE
ncbi:Uncharacterized protein dnm_070350 [Desulfonema magnum]|uniref:Uncharacterized protein n=1 Tax=Desulfonema magnum TaxID=45655 RepID=A0A975GRE7_9BACT|nr:Uncharacterized protein dnm_070350 [Desulfonema magnum]